MDLWPNKSYENINYIRFVYLGPEYVGVELGILKIGQLEKNYTSILEISNYFGGHL